MSAPMIPWPFSPQSELVDRVDLQAVLDQAVADARRTGTCAHLHVSGLTGTGITSLIRDFAWRHRIKFGAGAILVECDSAAMTGDLRVVLVRILRALSVPNEELNGDESELLGRVRNLLAKGSWLVVVEDSSDAAIVRSLLLDSPGSVVIVSSHQRLSGVDGDRYLSIQVRPLARPDTEELLIRNLRGMEIPSDGRVRGRLFEVTGGYPLAVIRLANLLRDIPLGGADDWLQQLTAIVADPNGEYSVNGILRMTYDRMSGPAQRAYRLLSMHPGTLVPRDAALALLGGDRLEAIKTMRELTDSGLVDVDADAYRLGVDWRDHSRRMCDEGETSESRTAAVERLVEWYFTAISAHEAVLSDRWRVYARFRSITPATDISEPVARRAARNRSLEWLERFEESIVGAVALADHYGSHRLTWMLCEALWGFFHLRQERFRWTDTHERGLAAALALDDPLAITRMHLQLAAAHLVDWTAPEMARRELDAALRQVRRVALPDIYRSLAEQSIHEWLGKVFTAQGDADAAIEEFHESWRIAESRPEIPSADRARIFALLSFQLGRALTRVGDLDGAAVRLSAAVAAFAAGGETDNHAKALLAYGKLLTKRGDNAGAVAALNDSFALLATDGSIRTQAEALEALADAHEAMRGMSAALDCLRGAVSRYEQLGLDTAADPIRQRIAAIEGRAEG